MKLKPFRAYDENEVLNLYSMVEASANAGDLAEFVSLNPADWDGFDSAQLAPYAGMTIHRYVNKAKLQLATSGNEAIVAGMLLWNVKEQDDLGRKLIYDLQRYNELLTVTSGETIPVLRRGMVMVSGAVGTPGAGSGIAVANAGGGQWKVVAPDATDTLGKFLSSTGTDGAALAFLDVK